HALFELRINVLRDDYTVVDHQPGSEHNAQHGEDIDRKPADVHDEECSDKGYGDIDKWPRRNSPVAEEKVDNQYNQDNRDDQRFLDLTDGAFDEHRLVHRDVKLDVIGNFVLDLLHSLVDRKGTRLNSSHVKSSYAVFG